jgi:hypothetical protein
MTELHTKTADQNLAAPDRVSRTAYPGTPRWVKVTGIITFVLILLVVIIMFVGGGEHGPGRHTPPSGVIERGVDLG